VRIRARAVAGEGSFATLFAQFVVLVGYWIAPWTCIVIADRYLIGASTLPPRRWESGALIWAIVTPVTLLLFLSTIYSGPIARGVGGSDTGFVAGFFGAAGIYVLAERSRRRRPDRDTLPAIDVEAA
jgi:NCS1 family nucleobase:cation symporter-1